VAQEDTPRRVRGGDKLPAKSQMHTGDCAAGAPEPQYLTYQAGRQMIDPGGFGGVAV
jgi:hypothetical protein